MDHIDIILKAAECIKIGKKEDARSIITNEYQHISVSYAKRLMTIYEKLKIYINDGFIDRYSGKRLLFPNVLRIFTYELGGDFPFHQNWKMSGCHIAYWEMIPTYDHVIPIARGGKDISENIITTSQIMNSRKSNFLVEEIDFKIYPKGNMLEWDGMISWYKEYLKNNSDILKDNYIFQWNKALNRIEEEKRRTTASTL